MNYGMLFAGSAIGGVVGAAVGSAIGSSQRKPRVEVDEPDHQSDGLAKSQRELNDNYWIHHGHLTSTPGLPDAGDSDISH